MDDRAPSTDNQVLVAVELMNLGNDISRFLLDEKPRDMDARRDLARNLRAVAGELETTS